MTVEQACLDAESRPQLDDDEELKMSHPHTKVAFGSKPSEGPGTLHVTTRRVVWVENGGGKNYSFTFKKIVMHALSKDPESYPKPCVYCHLDS